MNPDTPQLLDSVRAVRARWRLVLAVVVLSTGLAVALSLTSTKQYDATAQLLLRGEEPINALLDPSGTTRSSDPERDLNTEVELIKVGPTAHAVQRAVGLTRSTDELLAQLHTETNPTSDIVRLRVRDHNPVLAARIANAFASAYVQFRVNSARARYRQAADLAQQQLLALSPDARGTAEGRDLQARQRELQIASALQTGGAEVVRRASVPISASRPRPILSGALGLLLGLVIGIGAALVRSLVDRRFTDEREVEDFFGLPVLAAIPRPARRGADLDDPAQREAYGLLAANLQLATTGRMSSVVMITSPGPGDGKTSVTLGVARAYAQLGLSVIVIEADLRRPAFARYADVTGSAGLTGVLAGGTIERELLWLDADTMQPTNGEPGSRGAIGMLPAGTIPEHPQRALSDPAMNLVVEVARSLADVVLIDTAPVGTVNDATVLGRMVEGVAVVARLNQTTKDAARRASRSLANLGAAQLGLVVTDAGGGENHAYYAPRRASAAAPPAERPRSGARGGPD
ncbi:MAG: tyrosine-protein kinase [Solirubrobacteraceae bacterium]|jgi:capsular exopolysaccharide synthesis family protein|nr:tyrosine-protein kinase [Solirubrobacteraceae bacterium]